MASIRDILKLSSENRKAEEENIEEVKIENEQKELGFVLSQV